MFNLSVWYARSSASRLSIILCLLGSLWTHLTQILNYFFLLSFSVIEIQHSESIPYSDQLRVPSSLNALVDVLSWFTQLAHPVMPQSIWLRCQLALAEGFTNAVRHAHKNLPSEDLFVDMKVTVLPEQIIIWVWDYGPRFDLIQKLEQISAKTVDKNAGGGRGLKLIQDIADELSYERTDDNRNRLKIVKDWQPRSF